MHFITEVSLRLAFLSDRLKLLMGIDWCDPSARLLQKMYACYRASLEAFLS